MTASIAYAQNCSVICPSESLQIIEKEKILNKITGISFLSKNIAEAIIQKEINDELKSGVKAELEPYNLKRLKNGEFKGLTLKTKKLQYKALSISDITAHTICPYNKIIYKNKRIYFPADLSFKYIGTITNSDIKDITDSQEFQKEINKLLKWGPGTNNIQIMTPEILLKNGFIHFNIPIKTVLFSKPFNIKFKANIEVKNNKIVLRNITFNTKSNIINNDLLAPLADVINPLSYELKSINGKFCKVYITKAKIIDDKIQTEGVFTINKNYGGQNE